MKKLVMLILCAFISTVGMCNTSFGDDTPKSKSGAQVRVSSNGINWKKFHKKQKRKTKWRKKHCNMLLML
jgi:hypothetical protein